jgi:hypothetical protein
VQIVTETNIETARRTNVDRRLSVSVAEFLAEGPPGSFERQRCKQ